MPVASLARKPRMNTRARRYVACPELLFKHKTYHELPPQTLGSIWKQNCKIWRQHNGMDGKPYLCTASFAVPLQPFLASELGYAVDTFTSEDATRHSLRESDFEYVHGKRFACIYHSLADVEYLSIEEAGEDSAVHSTRRHAMEYRGCMRREQFET
ncbi:hypothetical protein BU16DRAFT_285952 [Lophium mytilinum]|uniref:Uncharacterized protein n=1 Tax=Lophium mytilinum TaxID=390894 RepID=A0A6A6R099_9PEZI|nr:hypothetical protein BU16DRAFT_285952 [Lophium mytilinum]